MTILRVFFTTPLYLGVFLNSLKCKALDRLYGGDESLESNTWCTTSFMELEIMNVSLALKDFYFTYQ